MDKNSKKGRNSRDNYDGDKGMGSKGGRRPKKKVCMYCAGKVRRINIWDVNMIKKGLSERGKILRSGATGACPYHQKQLESAVKILRIIGLLPFATETHGTR